MEVVFFLSGNGPISGVSNVHGNGLIYVKIKNVIGLVGKEVRIEQVSR